MKVLVIGGGGREHSLVDALQRSSRVTEVVCAPGNGGISQQARCVPVQQGELPDLMRVVEKENPDLTVVGPELPLSLGIVDALKERGLRVFGPTQAAAMLDTGCGPQGVWAHQGSGAAGEQQGLQQGVHATAWDSHGEVRDLHERCRG